MPKARRKYYAVARGRQTGIYDTWSECQAQTSGFSGAIFKSFGTREEAQAFINGKSVSAVRTSSRGTSASWPYVERSSPPRARKPRDRERPAHVSTRGDHGGSSVGGAGSSGAGGAEAGSAGVGSAGAGAGAGVSQPAPAGSAGAGAGAGVSQPAPPRRHVIAQFDGGSRGNPGVAGWGAVVKGRDDATLHEGYGYSGRTTNNVAEYQGCLAALRAARDLGAETVELQGDSQLVLRYRRSFATFGGPLLVTSRCVGDLTLCWHRGGLRQLDGSYQVKSAKLKELHAQCKQVLASFENVRFTHLPRSQNAHADRLANAGMDLAR